MVITSHELQVASLVRAEHTTTPHLHDVQMASKMSN